MLKSIVICKKRRREKGFYLEERANSERDNIFVRKVQYRFKNDQLKIYNTKYFYKVSARMNSQSMINEINQLEILQCIICNRMYNTGQRKPMLICDNQHPICKQCLDQLMVQDISKRKCPICRVDIIIQKVSQFRALIQMRIAASKIRKDGSIIKKSLEEAQKQEQQLKKQCQSLRKKIDGMSQKHSQHIQQMKAQNAKRQQLLLQKIKVLQKIDTERLAQIEKYQQKVTSLKKLNEQLKLNYEVSLARIEELQQFNSYVIKEIQTSNLKQTSKKQSESKQQQVIKQPIKKEKKQMKKQMQEQKITKKGPSVALRKSQKNDQIIDINYEDLQKIDLSDSTLLRKLYLNNNELTQIDLSQNTQLQHLNLSHNKLTGIDLSNNKILRGLDLSDNQLSIVFLIFNPDISVDLSNQRVENCDVMIECLAVEEKLCEKFIEEQTQIYRKGGNKWGNNCNKYNCSYSFQIIQEN